MSGRKDWVTNGADAELLVVFASTNPTQTRPRVDDWDYNPLITAYIIDRRDVKEGIQVPSCPSPSCQG